MPRKKAEQQEQEEQQEDLAADNTEGIISAPIKRRGRRPKALLKANDAAGEKKKTARKRVIGKKVEEKTAAVRSELNKIFPAPEMHMSPVSPADENSEGASCCFAAINEVDTHDSKAALKDEELSAVHDDGRVDSFVNRLSKEETEEDADKPSPSLKSGEVSPSEYTPALRDLQGYDTGARINDNECREHVAQYRHTPPRLGFNFLASNTLLELRKVAKEIGVAAITTRRKDDLIVEILRTEAESMGYRFSGGTLECMQEGYGFLRPSGLLPSSRDIYVSSSQIRRFGLRKRAS